MLLDGMETFFVFQVRFFSDERFESETVKKNTAFQKQPAISVLLYWINKCFDFSSFLLQIPFMGNDLVALHHLLLPAACCLLPCIASLQQRINSTHRPTRFRFLLKEKDVVSEVTLGFTQHGRPLTLIRAVGLLLLTLGFRAHRHPISSAAGIGFSGLLPENVFVRGYQNRSQACSSSWQSGRL